MGNKKQNRLDGQGKTRELKGEHRLKVIDILLA